MAHTLYEKALHCEAVMDERHNYEGQVRTHVLLPPVGLPDYSTGNHEDDAISTGTYLGVLSFRWAVTKDAATRRRARQTARALRKLQRLTGSEGAFACGFKRGQGPSWDEQFFYYPDEWHQAGEYRWVGDAMTDSLAGIIFGYALYYDLVADAKEKAQVAKDVDLIMGKIVDADMRIVDVDGRMTMWGNMCPVILEEDLNALEPLSFLRSAYHITKKRRFPQEYHRLIRDFGYHERAGRANANKEPGESPWDWNLAMSILYPLLKYETDSSLLAYYRRSLEIQWRGVRRERLRDPFFNWAYKAYRPEAPIPKESWQWLRDYEPGDPEHPGSPSPFTPPLVDRKQRFELEVGGKVQVIEAAVEGAPTPYLRAYWMGRYHGFIPADA